MKCTVCKLTYLNKFNKQGWTTILNKNSVKKLFLFYGRIYKFACFFQARSACATVQQGFSQQQGN